MCAQFYFHPPPEVVCFVFLLRLLGSLSLFSTCKYSNETGIYTSRSWIYIFLANVEWFSPVCAAHRRKDKPRSDVCPPMMTAARLRVPLFIPQVLPLSVYISDNCTVVNVCKDVRGILFLFFSCFTLWPDGGVRCDVGGTWVRVRNFVRHGNMAHHLVLPVQGMISNFAMLYHVQSECFHLSRTASGVLPSCFSNLGKVADTTDGPDGDDWNTRKVYNHQKTWAFIKIQTIHFCQ